MHVINELLEEIFKNKAVDEKDPKYKKIGKKKYLYVYCTYKDDELEDFDIVEAVTAGSLIDDSDKEQFLKLSNNKTFVRTVIDVYRNVDKREKPEICNTNFGNLNYHAGFEGDYSSKFGYFIIDIDKAPECKDCVDVIPDVYVYDNHATSEFGGKLISINGEIGVVRANDDGYIHQVSIEFIEML